MMAIKMKGIFKGLKIISQLFVHKEHEMEIGYPTDVKHVAHIGLGTNDTCPSWMNEFKGTEDLSAGSISSVGHSRQTSWGSLDFEQPRIVLPIEINPGSSGQETSCPDIPRCPKKAKRKKPKASSPTSSARSSSSRASFVTACNDFSESQRGFRIAQG